LAAEATPSFLYLPGLPAAGEELVLPEEEARYVTRVCRARAGECAQASDGRGALARLRLLEVRGGVRARVESREARARARVCHVLCGAPEGGRGDWLVEKLAELGVARFRPVECARGRWPAHGERLARWRRLAVAALRQSRSPHLMEVLEPTPLAEALAGLPPEANRWLADAEGPPADRAGLGETGMAAGLIGPSGGLAPDERQGALAGGFRPVRLAEARLRTETAALAWAALWAGSGSRPDRAV